MNAISALKDKMPEGRTVLYGLAALTLVAAVAALVTGCLLDRSFHPIYDSHTGVMDEACKRFHSQVITPLIGAGAVLTALAVISIGLLYLTKKEKRGSLDKQQMLRLLMIAVAALGVGLVLWSALTINCSQYKSMQLTPGFDKSAMSHTLSSVMTAGVLAFIFGAAVAYKAGRGKNNGGEDLSPEKIRTIKNSCVQGEGARPTDKGWPFVEEPVGTTSAYADDGRGLGFPLSPSSELP